MADKGISGFRSKFGGFHKDDVLQYINALQAEHSREVAAWQQQLEMQRAAYDKALTDANAALAEQFDALQAERAEQEQLQRLLGEQYETNRALRGEIAKATEAKSNEEQLRAQLAALQQQNAALQQQVAAVTAQREQAEKAGQREQALQQQVTELKAQVDRLSGENHRYQELVKDVGSFVVEVRSMGQRYLEDVNQRCRRPLSTMQQVIESLKEAETELAEANSALNAHNSSAELRLNELARELERSVNPAEESGPAQPAHFF